MKQRGTVFVGMSGGVDSSLSAYLLKQQGYTVVGVFIKVWHPDFLPCHWERERLDAMRVAAHLEIPFLTLNAEEEYKREVTDYFVREYTLGRTPNPDIMCNTHVKFGAFYRFARSRGADYIATGHYVQKISSPNDRVRLARGADALKDQSYFLWNIDKDALAHALFPVGSLTKKEVRALARKAQLPTAQKGESQGICFLGHVDIEAFLAHYTTLVQGPVFDEQKRRIGTHHGALIYTIGQRHGFSVDSENENTEPYYVVGKDVAKNSITVSHTKPVFLEGGSVLVLTEGYFDGVCGERISLQTRYRQKPQAATVVRETSREIYVEMREKGEIPAVGQSCVLYDKDCIIGGGIIERITANS